MIVPSSSMENLILEYVSTKSVLIAGQKFSGIVKLACPSLVKLPLLISAQQTRPNFLILPAEKSEDKYVFHYFVCRKEEFMLKGTHVVSFIMNFFKKRKGGR